MDLSQDGVVSKEEFLQLCQDPTIKSYMTSLDPRLDDSGIAGALGMELILMG